MASMNRVTFRATMSQVSVPASSANIGPGFDSLAIALDLRDHYAAQILDDAIFDVDVTGEGADDVKKDKNHLVIKAMMKGFEFMGAKPRGIALRALNNTPHGRGLGSSSSAIIGGLVLSRSLVLGGEEMLTDDHIIALATELEGHPDNVAAAYFGGATIAWMDSTLSDSATARAVKIHVDEKIKAIVFVPENHLATSKARKLLPETIPHAEAVLNTSHAALLVQALSHRPDLLFTATEDHLHQEYRAEAMPKSAALLKKLRAAGVAATISGAGPSVLVLHTGTEQDADDIIHAAGSGFTAKKLAISQAGAQ
jgi:homoserine kinase